VNLFPYSFMPKTLYKGARGLASGANFLKVEKKEYKSFDLPNNSSRVSMRDVVYLHQNHESFKLIYFNETRCFSILDFYRRFLYGAT
jgi:hypothetical protein